VEVEELVVVHQEVLEDLEGEVHLLSVLVALQHQDKEIMADLELQQQLQFHHLLVEEVVQEELEELEQQEQLQVLEVLDYQHFREILEFLQHMEHLDQHLEDILLVVEEEHQILLDLEGELVEQGEVVLEQFLQQLLVLLELQIRVEVVEEALEPHLEQAAAVVLVL
jgi:hypothetical protein